MTDRKTLLGRESILGRAPETVRFDMPEWGGAVSLRRLNLGDSLRLSEADNGDYAALLVAASVVDAEGANVFAPEDVAAIKKLPVAEINKLVKRIAELNGLDGAAGKSLAGNAGAGAIAA